MKNEEVCIINEELCIKNEGLCITNDEFCRSGRGRSPPVIRYEHKRSINRRHVYPPDCDLINRQADGGDAGGSAAMQ